MALEDQASFTIEMIASPGVTEEEEAEEEEEFEDLDSIDEEGALTTQQASHSCCWPGLVEPL